MLKLTLLTEDTNKSVSRFEKKIINLLEIYFEGVESDDIYYDPQFGVEIMNYLIKDLVIPFDIALEINYLYNNNIEKIRENDDSWLENPIRGFDEEVSAEQLVLSNHLKVPPYILTNEHPYYGMPHFQNEDDGHLYAVGDEEDVENAVKEAVDTQLWGLGNEPSLYDMLDSEYVMLNGATSIMNYIYIAEWAMDDIAKEDARREIEDWYETPEDILNQVIKLRPDIEKEWGDLLSRKHELEDESSETDDMNTIDLIGVKIDEIDMMIEELSERAKEDLEYEHYQRLYDWMKDDPLDWLYDFGYIGSTVNVDRYEEGSTYGNSKRKHYPDWIKVDVTKLKEKALEHMGNYRAEEFARYDGIERTVKYNNETYYIYKTE